MNEAAAPSPSFAALAFQATRPAYLPTSGLPALAGALVAINADGASYWLVPVAVLGAMLIHMGTDVTNEVEDFARGVDPPEKLDNSRVFTTGLMSVAVGRRLALGYFGAALVVGLFVVAVQGPAILGVGILGLLGGYLYTAGPRPYKYLGLGDPLIVFLMGSLMTQGAYTTVTGDLFDPAAFCLGFAPGFLINAVLEANNLSDIEGDRAAGVRTLAVRVGFGPARALFLGSLGLAYVVPVVLLVTGLFDWPILLPLVTLPLALGRAAQARAATRAGDEGLLSLAMRCAQLHLLFCALLVVGVVAARALAG